MRQVARDPFARETLFSRREYYLPSNRGCTWCGQTKHTPSGRSYLFRYWTETDGGRHFGEGNLFCSVECKRTYEEVAAKLAALCGID